MERREEAEKYIDDYLDMGCFKNPNFFRLALIEGYEFGRSVGDEEIKKLREFLSLIMIKCTDHDEYSRFEDYQQLANDIISITIKALKESE